LGKKWFGVSLYQDITPEELLSKISWTCYKLLF